MSEKKIWLDALTPKNTEEVKPGLFIQKTATGYRHIHPAAWNGKINWKNLLIGGNAIRNFVWFAIIMFLVFAYWNDTNQYREFYEQQHIFAAEELNGTTVECTEELEEQGLCVRIRSSPVDFSPIINFSDAGDTDSNSISSND